MHELPAPHPDLSEARLAAATVYLAMGYQPVPVPLGFKGPRMKDWQHLRSTPADLPRLFEGPGNIGLLLGEPSGWLIDIDLDCEEAVRLADQYLPPTTAITGRPSRPGSHRWYRCPGMVTHQLSDPVTGGMVVEIRSTKHQTLVGPSIHPEDGEQYGILTGEPAEVTPEALEAAVRALHHAVLAERGHLPKPPAPLVPPRRERSAGLLSIDEIPAEVRVERCKAYLEKCPDAVLNAGGDRNTYRAACECFRFGLSRSDARSVMDWFNLTKTHGEQWTDRPLDNKLDRAERTVHIAGDFGVRLLPGDRSDRMTIEEVARLSTDVGNAARFVLQHGGRFRFSYERDAWLVWDGRRWAWDKSGAAVDAAKQTSLGILNEARAGAGTEEMEAASRWAKASQRHQRITSMIALARPDLAVLSDDLDSDPWLFNCLNGTIDLRSGDIRPHDPEDLITHLAPVEYDPAASCPRFKAFLDRVFGSDQDLIAFVRRWHGYSLSGDVRHQYLPIYYGQGNNGKSVLLDTISAVMGDYAGEAPPDLMVVRKHAEHPTQVADLCGRRLVVASETEDGAELNLPLVKRLTGNERLKARFMRQDYFEFARTHKFVLVTNHKPVVAESTEAAWRRLLLVPFSVVIPPAERDPHLSETLRGESPGILAWLVGGAREDLIIPDIVRLATDAYRGRSNTFEEFLDAECEFDDPEVVTKATVILAAYCEWAASEGLAVQKGRAIGPGLRRRGCLRAKLDSDRAWRGIAIRSQGPNAPNRDGFPVDGAKSALGRSTGD